MNTVLDENQIETLRSALKDRPISVCFGSGVDSTAMIVALRIADIRPDAITFANTGGEKPGTLMHLEKMNQLLESWNWPLIDVCTKKPLASTGYTDLYGNCLSNQTLPSLSFGLKSCSIKWKVVPQQQFLKGVKRGPNASKPHQLWIDYLETGIRISKLIGYDNGRADIRRSKNLSMSDESFDYVYPLQLIGWSRNDCNEAIKQYLGSEFVPIKSACFFCPASKHWELFWLAAVHPELFEKALLLERTALTGKHSRFNEIEFGATWEELVKGASKFPSTTTTIGLGRSFSWNQWALVNGVVDDQFVVYRSEESKSHFLTMSEQLRGKGIDNAQDARQIKPKKVIHISECSLTENLL